MDYTNKLGITFFFKYFLGIPAILANIISTNPVGVLALLTASLAVGLNVATPFDAIGADLGNKTGLYDLIRGAFSHPILLPL